MQPQYVRFNFRVCACVRAGVGFIKVFDEVIFFFLIVFSTILL